MTALVVVLIAGQSRAQDGLAMSVDDIEKLYDSYFCPESGCLELEKVPGQFMLRSRDERFAFQSTHYANAMGICDSTVIDCLSKVSCDYFLDLIVHAKGSKWIQVNDTVYVSTLKLNLDAESDNEKLIPTPVMTMHRYQGNEQAMTLKFYTLTLNKDQRKRLIDNRSLDALVQDAG